MRKDLLFEEFLRASIASKPAFRLLPAANDPKPPDPVDRPQPTRRRKPTPAAAQPPAFKILGKDGQLSIGKASLRTTVDLASMILPRRITVPSQGFLRLDSDHGRLRVSCGGAEAQLMADLVDPINATGRGTFTLELSALQRLAKTRAEFFRFGLMGDRVEVECVGKGQSQHEILENGDPNEVPTSLRPDCPFKTVPGLGRSLYEATRFCAREVTRYVLAGIRLDSQDVVATDGKRLYCRTLDHLKVTSPITIPRMRLLESKAAMLDRDLDLGVGSRVWLRGSNWTLSVTPIEGNFPNYRDVIPKRFEHRWKLSQSEIARITRALPTLPYLKGEPLLRIHFDNGKGSARVRISSGKEERAGVTFDAAHYDGDEGTVALNSDFLFEALGVNGINQFSWNQPTNAVALTGPKVIVLIMPLDPPAPSPKQ
jgi:hypothetical protein